MSKNKLYLIVIIACFSGYLYLIFTNNYSEDGQISVCTIKNATGYPCPSCGTTRAVQALYKGDLIGVICIESLSYREWLSCEVNFAQLLSLMVSQWVTKV